MRILVLSNEVWNDKINGNNVTSNWFEGMDAEFANIYCSPEEPFNSCCTEYFQITDKMMLKSILRTKAGKIVSLSDNTISAEAEPKKLYAFLKRISGHLLRLIRELIWIFGRYDEKAMKQFIDQFKPDIIFSERMASCKMLRLEKTILKMTKVPMVAFTGDDEYSLRQLKISPFFWINRFMIRKRLEEMVKHYKLYYTLSLEQKEDYEKRFGCRCKILQKCGGFEKEYVKRENNEPIKLIYAGKFYCNRWKALSDIVEALKVINRDKVRMVLEIYTRDKATKKQNAALNDRRNSFIMGGVTQEELKKIYEQADIALHVESLDVKNRLETRLSFSTKIVDCINSGCAIMAYCWQHHSGYTYLEREDAAFCVSSKKELQLMLNRIVNDKSLIQLYAKKAYDCGIRNHRRTDIQKMLLDDFAQIINEQWERAAYESVAN